LSLVENLVGGSVAETAARAVVEKVFDATHVLGSDRSEVGPFGIKLPNQPIGALLGTMLVRTTLVRTTWVGGVYHGAVRVFHKVAAGELAAVVEGRGVAFIRGERVENLAKLLMRASRGLIPSSV
jgi:hypothetical protein